MATDYERGMARLAAVREVLNEIATAPPAPSPTANSYARRLTAQQASAGVALSMLDRAVEEIEGTER